MPFGEQALKTFICASIDEAVNLENALACLNYCERRVAVLHYAPIKDTLQGEPQELWPFLGSSRLCEVLDPGGKRNKSFTGMPTTARLLAPLKAASRSLTSAGLCSCATQVHPT